MKCKAREVDEKEVLTGTATETTGPAMQQFVKIKSFAHQYAVTRNQAGTPGKK